MVKHLWRICSRLFSCDQGVDGDGSGLPLRGDEGVLLVALLRIWFHFWCHRAVMFLVVCRWFCHATRDNSGVYDIFAIGYWVEFYLQEENDVTQDDHVDQQGARRPISKMSNRWLWSTSWCVVTYFHDRRSSPVEEVDSQGCKYPQTTAFDPPEIKIIFFHS